MGRDPAGHERRHSPQRCLLLGELLRSSARLGVGDGGGHHSVNCARRDSVSGGKGSSRVVSVIIAPQSLPSTTIGVATTTRSARARIRSAATPVTVAASIRAGCFVRKTRAVEWSPQPNARADRHDVVEASPTSRHDCAVGRVIPQHPRLFGSEHLADRSAIAVKTSARGASRATSVATRRRAACSSASRSTSVSTPQRSVASIAPAWHVDSPLAPVHSPVGHGSPATRRAGPTPRGDSRKATYGQGVWPPGRRTNTLGTNPNRKGCVSSDGTAPPSLLRRHCGGAELHPGRGAAVGCPARPVEPDQTARGGARRRALRAPRARRRPDGCRRGVSRPGTGSARGCG